MSILKVTYADLSHASKYAKRAANELDNYASKMEGGVARKISNISGGQSNRTSTTLYETQLKIAELRAKSDKLNSYANRIEQFQSNVKETDNKVAKRIKAISATFAKDNGFKMGKVSAFFEALAVNTVNSTSLGRWVKDVYNKAEEKVNDLKTEIKRWFRTGGGRYIIDVVGSVLNFTVAAVVAVIAVSVVIAAATVASVIIAVAAVVLATIEFANLISDVRYTKKAVENNKDDPAWAYRYGKTDTLSDSLRLEGNDKAANIVGITYVAASCVLIVDGIYNLGKMVISKSSSIKALVTNKKDTFKIFRYNKDIEKQVVNEVSKADLYNEFNKLTDPQARYEYLLDKAKTMDVSTEKNGAIFYAGRVETKNGIVTARQMAERYADQLYKEKGIVKLTLERTSGGKWMDDLKIYDQTASGIPKYEELGLTRQQADEIWRTLSSRYADGTSGAITAFTKNVPDIWKPKTIFWSTELPQLRSNPKVTHINIR